MRRVKLNAQGKRVVKFHTGVAVVCAGALLFGDWVMLVAYVGALGYMLYDFCQQWKAV